MHGEHREKENSLLESRWRDTGSKKDFGGNNSITIKAVSYNFKRKADQDFRE